MSKENEEIALLGGSFNPVHNHHVRMGDTLLEKNIIDGVLIIPCKNHALNKQLAHAEDRINMINLAFNNPKIKVSRIEIESEEVNYTINTIRKLKQQYPDKTLYWVIGADILHEMREKWYNVPDLLKETKFIIFNRDNYELTPVPGMDIRAILNIKTNNESSTEVRDRVKKGLSIRELVPLPVQKYIEKRGLYKEE